MSEAVRELLGSCARNPWGTAAILAVLWLGWNLLMILIKAAMS